MSNGELWMAIRGKLPALRDELARLADLPYQMESVAFDNIARKLVEAITQAQARSLAVMESTRAAR